MKKMTTRDKNEDYFKDITELYRVALAILWFFFNVGFLSGIGIKKVISKKELIDIPHI